MGFGVYGLGRVAPDVQTAQLTKGRGRTVAMAGRKCHGVHNAYHRDSIGISLGVKKGV